MRATCWRSSTTLIDAKTKALAINWDDELVKATVLTRDGAVVHPNFVAAAAPAASQPAAVAKAAPAKPAATTAAEPQAAPVKTGAAKAAAPKKAPAKKSRSAGHGRCAQEGGAGRRSIGAQRGPAPVRQEGAGQAHQECGGVAP